MGRMLEPRTSLSYLSLLRDVFEERPHLPIGRKLNQFPFTLAQFFRQTFQANVFIDRHNRRTHWMRVEFTNHVLKFWAQHALTAVAPVRDTGDLPQCFGALNESPKSRDTDGTLLSDLKEGLSFQNGSHRSEITMEMRLLLSCLQHRCVEGRPGNSLVRQEDHDVFLAGQRGYRLMVPHRLWKLRWERIRKKRRSFRAEERKWGAQIQINIGKINQ